MQREVFRRQLADDDRDEGDDGESEDERDRVEQALGLGVDRKEPCDDRKDRGLADDAKAEVCRGDADLGRRDVFVDTTRHPLAQRRDGAAALGQFGKLRFPHPYQRILSGHEERRDQHESRRQHECPTEFHGARG